MFVPVESRSEAELKVELTLPELLTSIEPLTGFLLGESEPNPSLEEPLRRR